MLARISAAAGKQRYKRMKEMIADLVV